MPSCAVLSFREPDDFAASIRAARTEMTVTGGGPFIAGVVDINLNRMWMQRFTETVARVTHSIHACGQAVISFRTQPGPPLFWAGVEMQPSCIMRHGEGQDGFQRSTGPAGWGVVSLPIEAALSAEAATVGCDLAPPRQTQTVIPPAAAMERLQHLHAAIARAMEDMPESLDNPAAVHGMEQSLMEAMVVCLGEANTQTDTLALQHQTVIMHRFRRALERHRDQPVYIPELCAEIGVSDRALRACCREQLGMGPHRYLLLRRMHLARRALLGSAPTQTTVTDIATRFGFWQFGRFAQEYKTLFGEVPSATLGREAPEKQRWRN